MKTGFKLLVGTLSVSLLVGTSSAQRTGTRLGKNATVKDSGAAIMMVASCMADRRPAVVRSWLAMLPGSPEEHRFLEKQTGDISVCMDRDDRFMGGRELAFRPRHLRYPIAAALVARQIAASPSQVPVAADTRPWFVAKLDQLPPSASVDRAALALQDFGHCVATGNWSTTRAFLGSQAASAEEARAIKSLIPTLGPCLSQGLNMKLNADTLRRALAEPVYHILEAIGTDPAAGTKR